jgi:hypothetical protein
MQFEKTEKNEKKKVILLVFLDEKCKKTPKKPTLVI